MFRQEQEISDLFWLLLRRSPWLIGGALLVAVIAYMVADRKPPVYQAVAYLDIGRINQAVLEEPHLLAEIINAPGFLNARNDAPAGATEAGEAEEGGGKRKKRRGGGPGKVSAECLETGRKRERIVYAIRLTAEGEDKAAVRNAVDRAVQIVIERHQKIFDETTKLYRDREAELAAALEKAHTSTSAVEPVFGQQLFEIRLKLLSSDTYPTRLAREVTAPVVISAPQPKRNALVAATAALLLGVLVIVVSVFVRRSVAAPQATKASDSEVSTA